MITIFRIALLLLTLPVFTVQADDFENVVSYQSDLLVISQGNGLVITLPVQTTDEVLRRVQGFSTELNSQKIQCAEDVENTRFKTKDAIITAIMPGGLLYAAIKKQRHTEAKDELNTVTAQLNGLESDLYFLKVNSAKAVLASR